MILEHIALDITLKAIWEMDYSNSSMLHVLVASSSTRALWCQRWHILLLVKGILSANISTGDAVKMRSLLIRLFLRSHNCLCTFLDCHPVLALEFRAINSPAGSTAMVHNGSSEHSKKSIAY